MSMDVQVNLRIPALTVHPVDQEKQRIDNSTVRFTKVIRVPAFPKPGVSLEFVLRSGHTLTCEVVRADWSEEKALFVLSCTYSKRSIAEGDYLALINDPDWTVRQLLPE